MKPFLKPSRRRWVVKLGTGILTDSRGQLDLAQMARLARQVGGLHQMGHQIILVTSGAIGAGMGILGLKMRPKEVEMLQTCAAIGQTHLMSIYQELFALEKLDVAQLLFTYLDMDSRSMYGNARKTLARLLELKKFIPIVNENDVVANEEIKFGDNDRLSAHVAVMVEAGRLVILSNVPGLMSRHDGTGRIIPRVKKIDAKIEALAGKTHSQTSVGGMASKIIAARMATEAGIPLHIAHGRDPEILLKIASNKKVGTVFLP